MQLRKFFFAFYAACLFPLGSVQAGDQPNIVVILADDLGNADLGYRGSQIKTPNIDALAKGGARLEAYYGLPLCSPARAALMTGRYPMRYGLQTAVIFPNHKYGLPTAEKTLPQALKEVGYGTYMVGKWHLGHADHKFWPNQRGFDHFYGNVVGEVDYFTKDRAGVLDWQRNGKFVREDGYFTTQIGDEAVSLIENHDRSKPMFLYFASLAPHAPFQAPQEDIDAYKGTFDDETKRIYAAMITCLDTQVGRIVEALEKAKMRDNTLIVFTSDNGGAASVRFASGAGQPDIKGAPPASNAPFSGGKGTLREGGVRVPAIYNWPGKIKSADIMEPLHHVDLMPTVLALAGGQADEKMSFDGKNAWSTIAEGKPSPHEDIVINVELFRGAIRKGKWKLIKTATLPGKVVLFDLDADISEKTDLAAANPEVVKDLESRLETYATQAKMSQWLLAQQDYFGLQGQTVLDLEYNVDRGPENEKPALPKAKE